MHPATKKFVTRVLVLMALDLLVLGSLYTFWLGPTVGWPAALALLGLVCILFVLAVLPWIKLRCVTTGRQDLVEHWRALGASLALLGLPTLVGGVIWLVVTWIAGAGS